MKSDQETFYDKESEVYSSKRYDGPLVNYIQYLFRKRYKIFENMVGQIISSKKAFSVFEIGCADGVILQKIYSVFPNSFSQMVGSDISPGMVATASERNKVPVISFVLRGKEDQSTYDMVIKLGVHDYDFKKEIEYVVSKLNPDGYYVYSIAGRNSLHARIKLKDKEYVKDYPTYKEAEHILREYFYIIKKVPYGLFVPKLWTVPFIGRYMQSFLDMIFRLFFNELFHEKIYLLKRRTE